MTRRPTTRRDGTSLLEVLVGLGIMAVGAISVFVLFPLSAINVSRAMIDDRTTTCAIAADNALRDIHRWSVAEPEAQGQPSTEPYHLRMDNPGSGLAPLAPTEPGPSYPVVVDPMGVAAGRGAVIGNGGTFPGGTTLVPRVDLNLINGNKSFALRFCSQMDGLTFDEGGAVPGGVDMRELRYNWMWVLQRPANRDRYTVRQRVVVFDKRAHLYVPPNSEAVYAAAFTPGETAITGVSTTAEVRRGSWVMDGTIQDNADPVNPADPAGAKITRQLRHAEFYRVVSVTEVPDASGNITYTLEVHKPIVRADGLVYLPNPAAYGYVGRLVLFPAAVEVFDRPALTGGLTGQ